MKNSKTNNRKQMFSIRVTREEFLTMPMKIRRRSLRDMANAAKHNRYLDALDVEENP